MNLVATCWFLVAAAALDVIIPVHVKQLSQRMWLHQCSRYRKSLVALWLR